jgi:Domain of unknown function (DUF397)
VSNVSAIYGPEWDSKNPGGPVLAFSPPGWEAFTRAVKAGELGLG